jgi:GT2 family glycosyltransferase
MDRVEVVIADGGSTDGTRAIAETFRKRFGSLKVLDNPGRKPSSGRNVGIRNSVAPYILVLDGHTFVPSKTLLTDMVELFRSTEAGCLCRPQPLTPPELSEFERAVALCRGSLLGHKPGSEIYSQAEGVVDPTSSGAMYHRLVVDRIGYFDEEFDACEDVDFNYRIFRAGLKAVISPKLTVYYYPRSTIRGLWKQMLRYGKGRFKFSRKHRVFAPVQWLAAAGVVGLALLLLLSLVSSQAASLLQTVVGLYVLLVIFFSGYLVHKHRRLGCLLYGPIIFPTIHFGLGIGFLAGLLEQYLERPPKKSGIDLDMI